MQYKQVFAINNYYVYCCYDQEICYYISIPKNNRFNYGISVDIDRYIEIEKTEKNKIQNKLFEVYSSMDNTSLVLIIPIIPNNTIEKLNNPNNYITLANVMTKIIKNAHQILMTNKIVFDNVISFIDDENYASFINWLGDNYLGQIRFISIIDIYKKFDIKIQHQLYGEDISRINVQGLNFIVGTTNEQLNKNQNALTIEQLEIPEIDGISNPIFEEKKLLNANGSVGYWFLGVLSILIIVGVVLFFLIKK